MPFNRGDIIDVYWKLPDGQSKNHPALILSSEGYYQDNDGMYMIAMLSSTLKEDIYTFLLDNSMLSKANSKDHSQVRTNLVTYIEESEITDKTVYNHMKEQYVDKVAEQILENSLSEEF